MFWFRVKELLSRFAAIPVWARLLIAALGLGVVGTIWRLVPSQRPWLHVLKDKEGAIVGLQVEPRNIPKAIFAGLPDPDNNTPLRDPVQIKALAEHYGLYQRWETNSHLCFDDGTIAYWSEQKRPCWELELQFLSRRLVLEAADRAVARIPNPGDLSYWSERVYPVLFKKTQER